MKTCAIAVFVACLTISLTPAQSMFRGDPTHAGVYPGPAPRRIPPVKWKFPTGDRVVSSPVWHEGAIYFGGDDGNIYAVDAAERAATLEARDRWPGAIHAGGKRRAVYAVSYDGKLYALDARNGSTRWKFTTGGERRFEAKGLHGMQPKNQTIPDPFDVFLSSPVVAQGAVYFGSGDGNLYALDAATGELRWKFQTGDVVHASPAYADGVLFFGSWDSYFYAVEAATGKEKWRFHGGEDPLIHNQVGFQSSPAVVGGVVYTGCRDAQLYALDAATGKEKWRFDNALSWVISSPAVTQGKVYFATSDSSLYHVVDAATGKPVLKQQDKSYMFSSPAIAGDVVFDRRSQRHPPGARPEDRRSALEFRDRNFKENKGWVLTKDRSLQRPAALPLELARGAHRRHRSSSPASAAFSLRR